MTCSTSWRVWRTTLLVQSRTTTIRIYHTSYDEHPASLKCFTKVQQAKNYLASPELNLIPCWAVFSPPSRKFLMT